VGEWAIFKHTVILLVLTISLQSMSVDDDKRYVKLMLWNGKQTLTSITTYM